MHKHSSTGRVILSRNWFFLSRDFPSRPSLDHVRTTSSLGSSATTTALAPRFDTDGTSVRRAAMMPPSRVDDATAYRLKFSNLCFHSFAHDRRARETLLNPQLLRRLFHSEAEYHRVADGTLHTLQDAIDEAFERYDDEDNKSEGGPATPPEYELTVASGVLTLTLPGRGTWVLNKQTPNQQIWWSSPLSGPKRFEFLEGAWCSTKDGLTLGPLLSQELRHVHPRLEIDLTNL